MASIWLSPPAGILQNAGEAWRRGDTANIVLTLDPNELSSRFAGDTVTISLVGGGLPPGLYFNNANNKILGTITALPKNIPSYEVLFRVSFKNSNRTYDRGFSFPVNLVDEEQYWAVPTGIQDLGSFNRGSGITIQLDIVNPDNDALTYTVVGYEGPSGSMSGLPVGLSVDSTGRIIGSPTVTDNNPGDYYFRIYIRSATDIANNPHTEGVPRTSNKIFKMTLTSDIVVDARLSDTVVWNTPAGSLGSTYESFPSHFMISASPQFISNEVQSTETQMISYTVISTSSPLPDGLTLDTYTGHIIGRCPYVSNNKTYTFTVEAQVVFVNNDTNAVRQSTITSQRTFSLTIRDVFASDNTTSLEINLPSTLRREIVQWISGNKAELREENLSVEGKDIPASKTSNTLTILSSSQVFRPSDQYFGRKSDLRILLVNGLFYSDQDFTQYLLDYHHPKKLYAGTIKSAKAYSPDGMYVYDVIYLSVIDPLQGAGGFDASNKEQLLTRYKTTGPQKQTAIPQWNLAASKNEYYPSSVSNWRNDLIQTQNRLAGSVSLGFNGKEGLPLWMTCLQTPGDPTSVLGYTCAVELVYVQPGSGDGIAKTLATAGFNTAVEGWTIDVDRYLLNVDGFTSTTFDGPDNTSLPTDLYTTFDGPDNLTNTTAFETTFDRTLIQDSKYLKFPLSR